VFMGHDKKEKLQKGLQTHKTGKGDGSAAQKCDNCDAFTKYNGVCIICHVPTEEEQQKYYGVYKPYERLL
jgi:hypothetical protein